METPRGTFAPFCFAMTIMDDKKSRELVESFMKKIPSHLHGRLIIINDTTKEEHLCADRYASISVFLASHWSIPNCRFRLTGYRYVDSQKLETTIPTSDLESMGKPPQFLEAIRVGEVAWDAEKQKQLALQKFNSATSDPPGRYEWVLVPDE